MKKAILFVFILSTSASLFAQNQTKMRMTAKFGIHAGANFANITEKSSGASSSPSSITRFNAGVFAELPVVPSFAIQPEVNYSGMGAQQTVDVGEGNQKFKLLLDYISIPVLLKYKVPNTGFGIYIAPQYSFLMSAKSKVSGQPNQDVKDQFKGGEFSGLVGAEYFLPMGFGISARYQAGFSDVSKNTGGDESVKNHAFTLTLGYKF